MLAAGLFLSSFLLLLPNFFSWPRVAVAGVTVPSQAQVEMASAVAPNNWPALAVVAEEAGLDARRVSLVCANMYAYFMFVAAWLDVWMSIVRIILIFQRPY